MVFDKRNLLRVFFFLAFMEGIVTLFFLVVIPSDLKNSILLGLSAPRLVLIGGILGIILCSIILFYSASNLIGKVDAFLLDPRQRFFYILFATLILIVGILFFCIPAQKLGEALVQRLIPLVGFAILIATQMLIGQFVWLRKKMNWDLFVKNNRVWRTSGTVLLFFIVIGVLITWSGIGIDRGPSGWLSPGTPVLPQQLLFSAFVGFLFFVFRLQLDRYKKADFIIGVLIWILAAAIWWFEPMTRLSYFAPAPTPPNFEYYPYSDALHYDWFAQNLLIGASRNIGLTHRPLYSIFLALLHFMGGNGLSNVLFIQVIVLAVIPSITYLLVSRLGNRPAGVMTALMLIIRERNSIALTNIIEVSHVKLIMSDVPTMLTMILFIYFFVKWFQEREDKYVLGVLAGVSLGFSIFIRSQAQLLIPIALAGMVLIERFNWRSILQKAAVFLLSVAVIVIPWVWRNYQLSGRVLVEYLDFYTRFIAGTYSSKPGDADIRPGETDAQYRARVKGQIVEYIVEHPTEVSRFYLSYFLHNEIASVAYLPLSFRFDTIYKYVDTVGFWDAPYLGGIPFIYLPALFLIVCTISFGIGVTFQRFRWIGVMPILFHLVYSFSSVPVRQSGWRFILPVDWVVIVYFCIGLTEFCLFIYSLFSNQIKLSSLKTKFEYVERTVSWRGTWIALASFALLGLAIPLVEWSISQRYPSLPDNVLIESQARHGLTLEDGRNISTSELGRFLESEAAATVLYGRALYPSYYGKGAFWGEASPDLLEASKYNRLQFTLIGNRNLFVFIPLSGAPQYFPHASDVFVIGCQQDTILRALIIKVNDHILESLPWHGLTCSVTE